jgi:branched-subunit amino acid transport protein
MNWREYLLLFAAMGLVTYLPRCLPLLYLAHRQLPKGLIDWLSLIPAAILSALLAPILFTDTTPAASTWAGPNCGWLSPPCSSPGRPKAWAARSWSACCSTG